MDIATQTLPSMDFPGQNTEAGCYFLLQVNLTNKGLDLHLLQWQADSLPLLQLEIPLLKIKEEKKSRKRKQQLNLANQP